MLFMPFSILQILDLDDKERFLSILKSRRISQHLESNFVQQNEIDYGNLTSPLNKYIHDLFLTWVLYKLKHFTWSEKSVLQFGQLFTNRNFTCSIL